MYAISNATYAELLRLLPEMEGLKGRDNKTVNVRRRAKLTIQKLRKCQKVNPIPAQIMKGSLIADSE